MDQSRRKFICQSLCAVAAGAAATVMPVLAGAENTANEVPAYPYPYKELDPAVAEKIAYEGYFENGCCYGVAKGLLAELREKVGYPYTVIPAEMFACAALWAVLWALLVCAAAPMIPASW